MSDNPFSLPPPPLGAERARDVGRSWKAMSDHLRELGDMGGARHAERQSHWWLTYAVALAQTKEGPGA